MNVEGITLKLLLCEQDSTKALEALSKLRPRYFSNTFKPLLNAVTEFYNDRGSIPSLEELSLIHGRDAKLTGAISTLSLLKVGDIELELAIAALEDQFAQNTILDLIDGFLTNLPLLDRFEIQESVAGIPMHLEDSLDVTDTIFTAKDIPLFKLPEALELEQITSGISDEWDREAGGYFREDLVLLGGKRGSGKSVVCANLVASQHRQGNVSIYFTIEMPASQIFNRIIGILAGVPASKLKKGDLDLEDKRKLGFTLASLFEKGEDVYARFFNDTLNPDIYTFQDVLYKTCKEKDEGKIIIVDDSKLTLASAATKIASVKARYGDQFAVAVIDYLNQMTIDGEENDMYDWKPQIVLSKSLKKIARKENICIISPYQMDDNGQARFSKGILDAPDVAQLIQIENKDDKDNSCIVFETTKARAAMDTGKYRVRINWDTLSIDPRPVHIEDLVPTKQEEDKAIRDL